MRNQVIFIETATTLHIFPPFPLLVTRFTSRIVRVLCQVSAAHFGHFLKNSTTAVERTAQNIATMVYINTSFTRYGDGSAGRCGAGDGKTRDRKRRRI
jgi:hypothetical protein